MNLRSKSSLIPHPSSLLAAFIALLIAAHALALDVPPKPTAWVTDNGGVLRPEQEQALNENGRRINPNYSPQSRSLPSSSRRRASGSSQLAPRDLIFLLVLVFIFLVVIAPIMRRSGCGGCGGCFWPMMFMGGGGGRTFG